MSDKEKEQKALEIYQQLIRSLEGVTDISEIVSIVNNLIEENGLSPAKGDKIPIAAKRKHGNSDSTAVVCPSCGSTHIVKNGSAHGKRRFRCNECRFYFCTTSGKLTEGSSASEKTWNVFIEGMLSDDTLPVLADKCHISLSTAHAWRMKLFSQVGNSVEGKILKGVIQEDEFYLSASFKGNWKSTLNLGIEKDYSHIVPDYQKYGFRDQPHERGSQDSKRGLSKDKVCVATAIDESRNIIGKPIGRGNVSSKGLSYAFTGKMDHGSILVIDKSKGGITFARASGLAHFALDSKKESRKGTYNLQLVNALHSVIAEKTHSRSCFATKNAEAYITWEAWKLVNRRKSIDEKKNILKALLIPGKKTATNHQIRHTQLPSILHPIANHLV